MPDTEEKLAVVSEALKAEVVERRALEAELATVTEERDNERHAALHDPLTGLPNRTLFDDRLEYGLAQAGRFGWSLAVVYIDVNDFKVINDTHGHAAGDAVLQAIAQRLRATTRDADTVSRYGGDEFLCLVTGTIAEQDIKTIVEKIVRTLATPVVVDTGDGRVNLIVSVSVGVANYPKHGTTADALIKFADAAMYQAKQGGETVTTP